MFQNYTFVGKPNNGLITTNSVGRNQLLLAGNPYPSALDADAFIRDNLNTLGSNTSDATNGSLYFWEHYSSNTHILQDYQGGYAVRNLVGGIAPSSSNVDFISKLEHLLGYLKSIYSCWARFFISGRQTLKVIQSFLKNSQRLFVKEDT
jgi:hypothetical protein